MNYQRKHRFYIMNQNNGDGIYMNSIWGPENYISYEEKGTPPPEHLTNILGLRMKLSIILDTIWTKDFRLPRIP